MHLKLIGSIAAALLLGKGVVELFEWFMDRTYDQRILRYLQDRVFYATTVNGVSAPQPQPVAETAICTDLKRMPFLVKGALKRLRRKGKATGKNGIWYYKPH
jgi:hypothetical protein